MLYQQSKLGFALLFPKESSPNFPFNFQRISLIGGKLICLNLLNIRSKIQRRALTLLQLQMKITGNLLYKNRLTFSALCDKSFGGTIKHSRFKGSVLILFPTCSLREKCSCLKFFWTAVRMRKNTDQNKSKYRHFTYW